MNDEKIQKYEKRLWDFSKADESEWERITENPELHVAVYRLQMEYGFPLSGVRAMVDWMGWSEPIEIDKEKGELIFGFRGMRRQELDQKLKLLEKEFDISNRWSDSLRSWVMTGGERPTFLRFGFPDIRCQKKDGKLILELIITPETDLDNPLIQDYIKKFQEWFKEVPPMPELMRGHKTKLDWRPVWEWEKHHPDVTREGIARMLHHNYDYIKKALERLDKEK